MKVGDKFMQRYKMQRQNELLEHAEKKATAEALALIASRLEDVEKRLADLDMKINHLFLTLKEHGIFRED